MWRWLDLKLDDLMQYCMMRYEAYHDNTLYCIAITCQFRHENEIERNGMEWNGMELSGTVRNGTVRNATVMNGTVRNRTEQYGMERNSTERNGTEWNRTEHIGKDLKATALEVSFPFNLILFLLCIAAG